MAAPGKQNLAGLIARWLSKTIATIFLHTRFQLWALWAVGPVFVVIYGAQIFSVLSNVWPQELAGDQLRYVGIGSWISLGIIAASFILMANVIKKANLKVGAAELEVETTTTVTETRKEEDDGTDDDPR